jgi:hypothetical protein
LGSTSPRFPRDLDRDELAGEIVSDKVRLVLVAAAILTAVVATVLVTRHVVWGGEPTDEGTLGHVRPGGDDAGAITAYHYRLASRFGYYVKIHVTDAEVSVSGPRLSPGLYAFFIGGQVLLTLLTYTALFATLVYWNWRYLLVAAGLFVGGFVFTLACAGGLWALPDVMAIAAPGTLDKVTVPLASVRDVRVGPGWDRQGIKFVIGGMVKAVDAQAGDRTVSFLAPDPTTKRYVTYGVCAYTSEDAAVLAERLRGGEQTGAP